MFGVVLTFVGGVVSVRVHVLQGVWVAGPSRVGVTTMLLKGYWSVFDIYQS